MWGEVGIGIVTSWCRTAVALQVCPVEVTNAAVGAEYLGCAHKLGARVLVLLHTSYPLIL